MPDWKVPATLLALVLGTAAAAETTPESLVAALREGGHVLYIRHAATEQDYADQVTADPDDCATQRMLSEAGWQDARAIGQAVERLDIPVGEVISSQYCRSWQTADLAFGRYVKDAALNFEPAEDFSEAQIAAMRGRVLPLLAAPVEGPNRVIVGHDDPFEAATGLYPEPQGVAYVVRPEPGGAITILGSIGPGDWPERQ